MEHLPLPFLDATLNASNHGFYAQILLQYLGVDVSQLVSLYLVIYTLYQAVYYLSSCVNSFILSYFTSYIEIDDWDPLYNDLTDWATAHSMTKVSRELKAITFDPNSFPSVLCTDGGVAVIPDEADPFSSRTLFNFQKWGKKNALIYKPNFSGAWFFHHSRCFYWSTGQRQNRCGEGYDRTISIRCFGRSTQPVKDLLSDIKGFTLTQEFRTTEVHRSALKSNEQGCQWLRQLVRPARPMCTISLGDDQKANIIQDMNNYLHPATARWYATRGIPYRRGYLLHGPPGTGKTSLSFALAGVFGLSIYCIALGETGLTESDLATLFSGLPERCIVLLEDVDSAGLRGGSQDVPSNRRSDSDSENVPVPKHVKRAKSMGRTLDKGVVVGMGDNKARSLITLAGLLNIVDGAASQEGRVLIMTTNCLPKMDPALIRPGRVDLQIKFTLATHDQIYDIFNRMYSTEAHIARSQQMCQSTATDTHVSKTTYNDVHSLDPTLTSLNIGSFEPKEGVVSSDRLDNMAKEFASKVPSGTFSPAEIQGFLLGRMADPVSTLQDVDQWVSEQLKTQKV